MSRDHLLQHVSAKAWLLLQKIPVRLIFRE
jgi:hypothetical protein